MLVEFSYHPILIWTLSSIIIYLHRLQHLSNHGNVTYFVKLLMRALTSLMDLVAQGYHRCWYVEVSMILVRFGFSLDILLSLSIDVSQTFEEYLIMIWDVIYMAFIYTNWVSSLLRTTKLDHYAQHYL